MKIFEKFYKWCHFSSKQFAVLFVCFPILVMILEALLPVESLFLPVMGLMILLGLFFLWGDRYWWQDVEDRF